MVFVAILYNCSLQPQCLPASLAYLGHRGNSLAFVLRRFPSCSSTNTNTFLGCVLVLLLHFSAVCFSHQVAARKPLQVRLSGDSDPGLHARHGPFRPPPTDGHLLYFQCFARVSLGHLLLRGGAFISMRRIPGRQVAGCRLCGFASAMRFMGLLSKGCMRSRSQQQWVGFHSSCLPDSSVLSAIKSLFQSDRYRIISHYYLHLHF